jgi:hypothetical protein
MFDLQNVLLRYNPQTQADKHNPSTFLSLYSLALAGMFLVAQLTKTISTPIQAQVLSNAVVEVTEAPTSLPSPTPTPSAEPIPEGTDIASLIAQRPHIEKYIKTIFPDNWKTALAIARAESGRVDPKSGEFYYRTYAINKTAHEISVGVFQVNLRSEYAKVHYDRIPGNNEQEKVEWLQDPFNSVLYAHWVYTHSGFNPWTVYSSGKYLAFVK